MSLMEVITLLLVAAFSFLMGMDFGGQRERKWQVYKRRTNRKIASRQRQVQAFHLKGKEAADYTDSVH